MNESTIRNCFLKSGFKTELPELPLNFSAENELLSQIELTKLKSRNIVPTDFDFEEYATCDIMLSTHPTATDITIAESIIRNTDNETENESDNEIDDESTQNSIPSHLDRRSKNEAINAIGLLKYYFQCDKNDTSKQLSLLHHIELDIQSSTCQQKKFVIIFK